MPRPILLMLLITALSACQRPPMVMPTMFAGAIDPLADAPAHEHDGSLTLFYATDRRFRPGASLAHRYTRFRSDRLDLGVVTVRFGRESSWDKITAATRDEPGGEQQVPRLAGIDRLGQLRRPAPYQPGGAAGVEDAPEAAFIRRLNEALKHSPRKQITVYIHGFKNDFEEAALTASELDLYTGGLGPFILYSWPSYDSLFEYSHDRDSVRYTTAHARRFVEMLADEINAGRLDADKINFIAHSSGAEVVGSVLREVALIARGKNPDERRAHWHIGSVLLIAPDISTDVARERVLKEDLRGLYDQIVVYSSRKDRALEWASRMLYRTPRIGSIREKDLTEADRYWLSRVDHVTLIDVDSQPNGDPVHHSHHRFSAAVVSDLILCLRTGLKPEERGLNRGEGKAIWRFADDYQQRVEEAGIRAYGKPSTP